MSARLNAWLGAALIEPAREMRMSYLPPLMVYLAAGVSGLTAVVGTFFVKEYLGLSAAFLASLGFWAGIPWALKMPLGHLVDLIWRWKSILVYFGAALIAASLLMMYGLITEPQWMGQWMRVEAWYVLSVLLAPIGYVIQDVVADAMTVEAVPLVDDAGRPLKDADIKYMHTTMQTLGRFAVVTGLIVVAALSIFMFQDVGRLSAAQKADVYATLYLMALAIPVISIAGVLLGSVLFHRRRTGLKARGFDDAEVAEMLLGRTAPVTPNWWIFGGSLVFAAFTLFMGLGAFTYAQEIIFAGSMMIVGFLMYRLVLELDPGTRKALVGTAIIIFIFRATPLPGPGVAWWEIDVLGFDQQFLSILTLITSAMALAGMLVFRVFMARRTIAEVVVLLAIAGAVLSVPNIGLFYGLHNWTSGWSGGVVDAHFIAVLDTAVESPLGQVAMIPMLAWIAKNAPAHLKATFFAVMASFTNLALSAASLGTKYLNQIYTVTREIRDAVTGAVTTPAHYSELGWLLIAVTVIALCVPLATIFLVQKSRFRTRQ